MSEIEHVEIYVEVKKITPYAILIHDGDDNFWIPKSQIKNDYPSKGKSGNIEITRWFAEKEGMV